MTLLSVLHEVVRSVVLLVLPKGYLLLHAQLLLDLLIGFGVVVEVDVAGNHCRDQLDEGFAAKVLRCLE